MLDAGNQGSLDPALKRRHEKEKSATRRHLVCVLEAALEAGSQY